MAEIATIARPYAEALFRVASGEKAGDAHSISMLAAWAESVSEMAQAAQHSDVRALVQNPKVPAGVVADTFISILKSSLLKEDTAKSQEAKNFIRTLADNKRLLLLPEIASQFTVLKNAHEGAADAIITSAFPLTEAQIISLCATLKTRFGHKLNPKVNVDETLIGGVRVMVGDEVLDTSVRAKLQKMQIALAA